MKIDFIYFLTIFLAVSLYIDIPYIGKPYPIMILISIFIFIFISLYRRQVSVNFVTLTVCLLFVVYLFKLILSANMGESSYVFNMLLFPLLTMHVNTLSWNQFKKLLSIFLFISTIAFIFEARYRFSHPIVGGNLLSDPDSRGEAGFYMFKENSLMYNNSNGVGMHLVFLESIICVLFMHIKDLSLYTSNKFFFYSLLIYAIVFFVLTCFSLSRAAVIVESVLVFLFVYINHPKSRMVLNLLLSFFVFAWFCFLITNDVFSVDDDSFQTKFEIPINLIRYLGDSSLSQILFGNVLNPYDSIYHNFIGFYGHTHYFDLIFTGGFVFCLIYILMLFLFYVECGKYSLFLILPFFLIGFSNIRIFAHYIYWAMGVIYIIKNYRDENYAILSNRCNVCQK